MLILYFFVANVESTIESTNVPKMMLKERPVDISTWGMVTGMPSHANSAFTYSFMARSILIPTKINIIPNPYFRYWKYLAIAAKAK